MEVMLVHEDITRAAARERAIQMLKKVGIPSPETRVDEYPHQLSGGMRQRIMIAIALACSPSLLIADEPTTALDVTIQAQILELMNSLQDELGMSILLITHDLGVVAETCDKVVVMYAGKVVEAADVYTLFERPAHPYTIALFASLPSLEGDPDVLPTIPGMVPSAVDFPDGCRFRARCQFATEICAETPATTDLGDGHIAVCHHLSTVAASREVRP
jgi:oligopeptide/dipeptide ABC transporter ATP-binding protein